MAAPPRLDVVMVSRGLAPSRQRAQAMILAGDVLVDETPCDKAATPIRDSQIVRLRAEPLRYVSRGGLKLEAALEGFGIDASGRVCADLGASTGGFTDCLLQRGAARVYAVDVGYGQLAWSLRQDARVVVMERTNVRNLAALPEAVSLVVGDLSFISLRLVLPTVRRLLPPGADAVLLVKPQFEVGRDQVGKGGLVRDSAARARALEGVAAAARLLGLTVRGELESPIPGAKAGNIESLLHLVG